MTIKRIEMDWQMGAVYDIFMSACELALQHQCDDVVFEFNGGLFSVSRSSCWGDDVANKLSEFPRKSCEVKL